MVGLLELIEETSDPAERRALADAATAEIVRHSVAEELFVYPVYSRVIADGADEVEHDKEEHQELEETLVELEGVDADDDDGTRLVPLGWMEFPDVANRDTSKPLVIHEKFLTFGTRKYFTPSSAPGRVTE